MFRIRAIAGTFLVCALTFGLLELAVRTAIRFDLGHFRDPAQYANPFCDDNYHRLRILWSDRAGGGVAEFDPDPFLGWSRKSNPSAPTDSSTGARRIAFFGDSFMAGVPPTLASERIPALVAAGLPTWQVIDRSAPGYGPDQMYLSLVTLLQDPSLRPEMCVVGLLLDDLDRVLERFRDAPKPSFELDEAGLLLQGIPVPTTEEALRREPPHIRSYVLALLRTKWSFYRSHGAPWESRCRASEKILLTRSLLEHMVRTCDLYGTSITFLVFYPQPDLVARTWREQQLRAMLTSLGRPVIDTRRSLTGRDSNELYFPTPNGHPNAAANRLVSGQILDELGFERAAKDPLEILFGNGGNSLRFVREGWCVAERDYTFTNKTRSSLDLQGEPNQTYLARLAVGGVAARPGDRRLLTVTGGDQIVGRWPIDALLSESENRSLDFELRADAAGKIRVTLDLPWLHRAADVGILHDSRVLGLAVRSLVLTPRASPSE